jgi:hypothetical protein
MQRGAEMMTIEYKGHLIELYSESDDAGEYWCARLNGVPVCCYALSAKTALATVRLLID